MWNVIQDIWKVGQKRFEIRYFAFWESGWQVLLLAGTSRIWKIWSARNLVDSNLVGRSHDDDNDHHHHRHHHHYHHHHHPHHHHHDRHDHDLKKFGQRVTWWIPSWWSDSDLSTQTLTLPTLDQINWRNNLNPSDFKSLMRFLLVHKHYLPLNQIDPIIWNPLKHFADYSKPKRIFEKLHGRIWQNFYMLSFEQLIFYFTALLHMKRLLMLGSLGVRGGH